MRHLLIISQSHLLGIFVQTLLCATAISAVITIKHRLWQANLLVTPIA